MQDSLWFLLVILHTSVYLSLLLRDARHSFEKTPGLASNVTTSHFCHVHGGRQKWTCLPKAWQKWVMGDQNYPGMTDIYFGGHQASLYLLLKLLGIVFAMFIEAGKNGQVLAKAWQKQVMDDPKQTRDARHILWRTSGIPVLAT